jgi:hypothetical protein
VLLGKFSFGSFGSFAHGGSIMSEDEDSVSGIPKKHCTALHCTALHCTALYCTALHWTALHCTALHCTALQVSDIAEEEELAAAGRFHLPWLDSWFAAALQVHTG